MSCAHCCLCLWIVYSNYFIFVSTLTLGLLYGLLLLIFFVLYVVFCLSSSCVLCPCLCLWIVYSNYFLFVSTLTLGLLYGLVLLIFFVLCVCFVCLRPVSCAHCCLCLWIVYSNYFLFVSTLTLGLLYGLVLLIFFVLYVVFCLSSSCVLCPLLPVSLDCLQ